MRSSQQCPVFQQYLGNTEAIDSQHHLQVTEVHFAKAVQQAAVTEDEKTPVLPGDASGCDHLPDGQVPPAGIEQKPFPSGRVQVSETAGAKSGAVDRENAPITPDLETVIEAWHSLPPDTRTAILAIVEAAHRR